MLEGAAFACPCIFSGLGTFRRSSIYRKPVSTLDWQPTALAAAGGKPQDDKELEGVDLLPYLIGATKGAPHETLYWRMADKWAIRGGDWKLCTGEKGKVGLYNLADDIGEANDLAAARPDKVKELLDPMGRLERRVAKIWPDQGGGRGGGVGLEEPSPAARQDALQMTRNCTTSIRLESQVADRLNPRVMNEPDRLKPRLPASAIRNWAQEGISCPGGTPAFEARASHETARRTVWSKYCPSDFCRLHRYGGSGGAFKAGHR